MFESFRTQGFSPHGRMNKVMVGKHSLQYRYKSSVIQNCVVILALLKTC